MSSTIVDVPLLIEEISETMYEHISQATTSPSVTTPAPTSLRASTELVLSFRSMGDTLLHPPT
jgi:hypothetical protein